MVDKTTPSESLLVHVTRIIVFTIIISVAVLAVDAVVLLLLNLLWNTDSWVMLLLGEGLAMIVFGVVEWTWQGRRYVTLPLWDGSLHRLDVGYMHHWFWVSFAMAGVVVIIAGFLIGAVSLRLVL